jgi:hypothetical protein
MKTFTGDTDESHEEVVPSEARAFFSATGARLTEEIWLCLETRWIADGAPVKVDLFRDDETDGRESLKKFDGKISAGWWEQSWKVEIPKAKLDEWHGPINLWFEATIDGRPDVVLSQMLLVHRTRFSS